MVKRIAIIPARGGSKRLPRKNIIDFLGKPIIAYSIEAAIESGCFDRVVVSTEDDEIANIAQKFGAVVAKRDPSLATDNSTLTEVCLSFLDEEQRSGREWQQLGCLYATAPLRTAQDIRATMNLLGRDHCLFSMAVTAYEHYAHQALAFGPNGNLSAMWPDLVNLRGSDLPALRAGNGSTYGVDIAAFRQHKTFYGPGLKGHDMPRERSIDIDTQTDLDLAIWTAQRRGFVTQ